MFTGLVLSLGTVLAVEPYPDGGARLSLRAFPMAIGESLAINGVCLTVQACEDETLQFEMVAETLKRTNLGMLKAGDKVNLERPLTATSPLGGHFVQGHIDTTAELVALTPQGNGRVLQFRLTDPHFMRYIVPKGSIAVDGISLTVVEVGSDWFTVWIIPHTWDVTNLHTRHIGDFVNIETDILARYVERLLSFKEA